jgi:hypothetical protein
MEEVARGTGEQTRSASSIHTVCRSLVEHSATATMQATELTGRYLRELIHAVIILSVMAPNGTETYVGETRSLYTASAGWSAASERTLGLIIKRPSWRQVVSERAVLVTLAGGSSRLRLLRSSMGGRIR